jgi:hypothetical protein
LQYEKARETFLTLTNRRPVKLTRDWPLHIINRLDFSNNRAEIKTTTNKWEEEKKNSSVKKHNVGSCRGLLACSYNPNNSFKKQARLSL